MTDLHKIRVNWTIPAPVILAIIGQAMVMAWVGATWKGTIEKNIELYRQEAQAQFQLADGRIAILERSVDASAVMAERVKGVEVGMDSLKEQNQDLKAQTQRIEQKLDTIAERRR